MRNVAILGLWLMASSAAVAQPNPPPQAHEQHQFAAQHSSGDDERCCCAEMMRKMMTEMHKHEGMSAPPSGEPNRKPADDQHKHPNQ
jgi:hypothetical protein